MRIAENRVAQDMAFAEDDSSGKIIDMLLSFSLRNSSKKQAQDPREHRAKVARNENVEPG
jgi:hypothetical protein